MSRNLCPPKNSPDKDLVMTPPELAEQIVDHFSRLVNETHFNFLEPCRGEGAFYNAMQKLLSCKAHEDSEFDWCELSEGKDFFDLEFNHFKYDFIFTNPPFSKYANFLEKSLSIANNVVFYGTVCHILSLKKRLRIVKEAGFYIREVLFTETPKGWSTGGFACGAIHLSKHAGDCKFSYL
jgi:hypothetical protein